MPISLRGMSLSALIHALPDFHQLLGTQHRRRASGFARRVVVAELRAMVALERFVLALALLLARHLHSSTAQLRCGTPRVHVSRGAPSRLERGRCRASGGRAPTPGLIGVNDHLVQHVQNLESSSDFRSDHRSSFPPSNFQSHFSRCQSFILKGYNASTGYLFVNPWITTIIARTLRKPLCADFYVVEPFRGPLVLDQSPGFCL